MNQSIAITAVGMVTGVGLNSASSCAAIRSAVDNFQETHFMDEGGEWIIGSSIPFEEPCRGKDKLIRMAAISIKECLSQIKHIEPNKIPLLLCLPEKERPGRLFEDDNAFFFELLEELKIEFHPKSRVIANGRVSFGLAMKHAQELINNNLFKHILIAATDSLLVGATLTEYQERDYLLTRLNSDGFIPGEAGSAFVVEPFNKHLESSLICSGLGFGMEKAHIDSEEPMRAEGLTTAIKQALLEANLEIHELSLRMTDISGKQYYFKEASLALSRIQRQGKEALNISHPADSIGEVGAAIGGVMLAIIKTSFDKDYIEGNEIIIQTGNDDGQRMAFIVTCQSKSHV